jgi:hypothetical protein
VSQKRIKNRVSKVELDFGDRFFKHCLGISDADAEKIIAARAKTVVDRVVEEAMDAIRTKPRTLREARLVKKFEVRG